MAGSKQADTALDLLFDTQLLPRRISYPDMAIINDPCACTYDISDETFGIHIRMFPFNMHHAHACIEHCNHESLHVASNKQTGCCTQQTKHHFTNCSQLRIRCCPAGLLPRSRLQKVSLKTSPHMEPHLQGQCIAIITQVHASTLMKLSAAEQCKRRV